MNIDVYLTDGGYDHLRHIASSPQLGPGWLAVVTSWDDEPADIVFGDCDACLESLTQPTMDLMLGRQYVSDLMAFIQRVRAHCLERPQAEVRIR